MQERSALSYLVAFIQPFQLDAVVNALRQLPSFSGMSVSEARGFGSHEAHPPRAGDKTEVHAFQEKVRIEVFCVERECSAIVETIRKAARTGNRGDGKVFTAPASSALRIRTGESGEAALRCDDERRS